MKRHRINRIYRDLNNTLGVFMLEGLDYPIFTNEPPWRFNEPNRSCIHEGVHLIKPHTSKKYGKCLKIVDVYGRTNILTHKGNDYKDTLGCIIPGLQAGTLYGEEEAVLSSTKAMILLLKIITEPCELEITNRF